MKKNKFSLFILILSLYSSGSLAQSLVLGMGNPEVRKYARCHAHFVREKVSDNDPVIVNLVSGEIKGTDACMNLLDSADLGVESNTVQMVDDQYDPKAMAILKTFNDLHRSWFSSLNFKEPFYYWPPSDIYDNGEMGYFYTRSLFHPSFDYSDVLKGDRTIEGIRSSSFERPDRHLVQPYRTERLDDGRRVPFPLSWGQKPCDDNADRNCGNVWENPPYNQLGLLVGIKERSPHLMTGLLARTRTEVDMYQNNGGGIIGSSSFHILNNNIYVGVGDGGLHVIRRWSKAVFEEVMCRGIPVVRIRDAIPYVSKESSLPFRGGEACMGCHASLDPMAKVMRNNRIYYTGRTAGPSTGGILTSAAYRFGYPETVDSPSEGDDYESWPDTISSFHNTKSIGRFYFRNMKGELINENVDNVQEVANEILKTPDFYACAAKRYLHFLTGINTILYDQGKLIKPRFSDQQKVHQDFVYKLGEELEEHKDLKRTIRAIIDSPYYLAPDAELGGL